MNAVKSSLKAVNEMVGYITIKSLSSWKVLEELKENLSSAIKEFDYGFGYVFGDRQTAIFSDNDMTKMKKAFFQNNNHKLLLSELDFSKCFITSEYLYSTIKKQNHFENRRVYRRPCENSRGRKTRKRPVFRHGFARQYAVF